MKQRGIQPGAADAETRQVFRVGAIAAFIVVVGWFLTFPVYATVGIAPPGVEARLMHYGTNPAGWWTILGLMVSTDLFYVAIWLALYDALKHINRTWTLLAVACHLLFVFLDLSVGWTNHAALFTLGSRYIAAATEAERAFLAAAASAPAAVLASPLASIYSVGIPALGTLVAGILMLKGGYGKIMGYLAVAAGITGIPAVVGPYIIGPSDPSHIVNAWLATIWYLLVAFRLLKLSKR